MALSFTNATIYSMKSTVAKEPVAKSNPLNLAIVLDEHADFVMAQGFYRAIKQKSAVLVSTPVLQHPRADIKKIQNKDWHVYQDKTNYFVLCIPAHEQRGLSELGFDQTMWDIIPLDKLEATLLDSKNKEKIIDPSWLEQFKKLWDLNNKTAKQIFIIGHGLTKTLIAGMPHDIFNQFLNILDNIHTRFLWITTCYAAGVNLLEMQQLMKSSFTTPSFITIVESIGEIFVEALEIFNIQAAGKKLTAFFDQQNPPFYLGKTITIPTKEIKPQKITLIDVIKALYGLELPPVTNLPDVYIPGAGFFRAVDVDNELIITQLALKRFRISPKIAAQIKQQGTFSQEYVTNALNEVQHLWQQLKKIKDQEKLSGKLPLDQQRELERLTTAYSAASKKLALIQQKALSKRKHYPPQAEDVQDILINVDNAIKYVLIYPQDLHDCSFILSDHMPIWISKISGKAQHIIGNISAVHLNFVEILQGFLPAEFFGISSYSTSRGWFINKLTCLDDGGTSLSSQKPLTITGVAIFHEIYQTETNQAPLATILCSVGAGKYVMATIPLPIIDHDITWKKISKDTYLQMIISLGERSKAAKDALYTASAGQETIKTQQQTFNDFLKSIGLTQKAKKRSKTSEIESFAESQIGKQEKALSLNAKIIELEAGEPSHALSLIPQLTEMVTKLIEQKEIKTVSDSLKKMLVTGQMKAAQVVINILLEQGHEEEIEPLGLLLLTNKIHYQEGALQDFFNILIHSGKSAFVQNALENFVLQANKSDETAITIVRDAIPSVIASLLTQQSYDSLKTLIKQLIEFGMPLEELIITCVQYNLDNVANTLAQEYSNKDQKYYAKLKALIKNNQQSRQKNRSKTVRQLSLESIIETILSPDFSHDDISIIHQAAELRMKAHDYEKASELLPTLTQSVRLKILNQLQKEAMQDVINIFNQQPQIRQSLIDILKQKVNEGYFVNILNDEAEDYALYIAKTLGYQVIRDIVILKPSTSGNLLSVFAERLVTQQEYAIALNIAQDLEVKGDRYNANQIFMMLPVKYLPLEKQLLKKDLSEQEHNELRDKLQSLIKENHEDTVLDLIVNSLVKYEFEILSPEIAVRLSEFVQMLNTTPKGHAILIEIINALILGEDAKRAKIAKQLTVLLLKNSGYKAIEQIVKACREKNNASCLLAIGLELAEAKDYEHAKEISQVLREIFYSTYAEQIEKKLPK